ncbi:MAG: hypothetical protein ACI935_000510 [Moritella dasanensis]|jgi:hypothetical protein
MEGTAHGHNCLYTAIFTGVTCALYGRSQILKCMVKNERAMQFYFSKGFVEVGKGTGVVGDYLVLRNE